MGDSEDRKDHGDEGPCRGYDLRGGTKKVPLTRAPKRGHLEGTTYEGTTDDGGLDGDDTGDEDTDGTTYEG